MVKRLLPLLLVPLAGCALAPSAMPPARPVTVDVPVAEPVYCAPPRLHYPKLPLAGLTANSPPADTIRAYAATVVVLKGVVRERDAVIAGCTAPAQGQAAASSGNTLKPQSASTQTRLLSDQTQRGGAKIQ